MITSSMVTGRNHWQLDKDQDKIAFVEKLISAMTIPLNDNSDADSEFPILFKDPTEDTIILLEYYPEIVSKKLITFYSYFYSEDKIKDPFLNIFSPPPQSV